MSTFKVNIPDLLKNIRLEKYDKWKLIAQGFESYVLCVENDKGEKLALKIYPRITNAVENEFFILKYLESYNFISPKVKAFGIHENISYLVQEWSQGVPFIDYALSNPSSLSKLGYEFGQWQARLHEIPFPDQFVVMKQFQDLPSIECSEVENKIKPVAVNDTFCHMDFHPGNILVNDGSIVNILDFNLTNKLDRRFDLAVTKTLLDVGPILFDINSHTIEPLVSGWQEGYKSIAKSFSLPSLFNLWGAKYLLNRSLRAFPHNPKNLKFFKCLENYCEKLQKRIPYECKAK